jgi:hypothetical protein
MAQHQAVKDFSDESKYLCIKAINQCTYVQRDAENSVPVKHTICVSLKYTVLPEELPTK